MRGLLVDALTWASAEAQRVSEWLSGLARRVLAKGARDGTDQGRRRGDRR